MRRRYSIGEVAKMLKISTRTLRFYDEKNLVKPAYIDRNGYRFYEMKQINQLEIIIYLKGLGFSLRQVKILLQDKHGDKSINLLLDQQYQENKQQIDELSRRQKQIEFLHKIKLSHSIIADSDNMTSVVGKKNELFALRRRMFVFIIVIGLLAISAAYVSNFKMSILALIILLTGLITLMVYYYNHVEYICPNCGKRIIPSFLAFNLAPHTLRFRRLVCPKCHKKSYCLEVIRESHQSN